MQRAKQTRLKRAGWSIGSAAEFLKLSREEAAIVEMKLALAESLRRRRQARNMTQFALARRLGSSQSRVAKMESADASVSIDLLVRSLLVLGATRQDVGRIIGRATTTPAA